MHPHILIPCQGVTQHLLVSMLKKKEFLNIDVSFSQSLRTTTETKSINKREHWKQSIFQSSQIQEPSLPSLYCGA